MKRLSSSDSLLPVCPSGEEGFGGSFCGGMEEDEDEMLLCGGSGGGGGGGTGGEKKRRLSSDQVRALERNFEVENKLEPERKARLARELGLQPRQVAVWFQNRRARWKTKQLERDYTALRASYDALRIDHDALLRDKDALAAEIKELKAKLGEGETVSFSSVKEEPAASTDADPLSVLIYKDGSSESDSSAVLNEPAEVAVAAATTPGLDLVSNSALLVSDATVHKGEVFFHGVHHGHGFLKVEEDEEFLGDEEQTCGGFFAELQPPTLSWYYESQQWN